MHDLPKNIISIQPQSNALDHLSIAILIPCFNEAVAIASVIDGFKTHLPSATVYVYDNNSTDATLTIAKQHGAIVRSVSYQGKGYVVRQMFADIDADVYVLVDGDATYHAPSAFEMIHHQQMHQIDMVVGVRQNKEQHAYRAGHQFGNRLLTGCVNFIFGRVFTDILSGYRVFSRRFVKSFPALSRGFEIETELSVHALALSLPVSEIKTPYFARPEGSFSKLSTYRDGWRILKMIVRLFRSEKPLAFFGLIAVILTAVAVILAIPLLATYWETGLVPRQPTAVLTVGLITLSAISLACGFILDTVTQGRKEQKRLAYLAVGSHKISHQHTHNDKL